MSQVVGKRGGQVRDAVKMWNQRIIYKAVNSRWWQTCLSTGWLELEVVGRLLVGQVVCEVASAGVDGWFGAVGQDGNNQGQEDGKRWRWKLIQ